jgi:hypothetical protein
LWQIKWEIDPGLDHQYISVPPILLETGHGIIFYDKMESLPRKRRRTSGLSLGAFEDDGANDPDDVDGLRDFVINPGPRRRLRRATSDLAGRAPYGVAGGLLGHGVHDAGIGSDRRSDEDEVLPRSGRFVPGQAPRLNAGALDREGDDDAMEGDAAIEAGEGGVEAAALLLAQALPGGHAAAVAAGGGGGVPAPALRELLDRHRLPGDVSRKTKADIGANFLSVVLRHWAMRHRVPWSAVTALLALHRGLFGELLGVNRSLLLRNVRGGLPRSAAVLHARGSKINCVLGVPELLVERLIDIPGDDPAIIGSGTQRRMKARVSVDLALNIVYTLMNPALNNSRTPIHHEREPLLPAGYSCGGPYFHEQAQRNICFTRMEEELEAAIDAQIPGTPVDQVGKLALGVHPFEDSINPPDNQALPVYGFLMMLSNWHVAVARSRNTVVLGGTYQTPLLMKAQKVAEIVESAIAPSKASKKRHAAVVAALQEAVVAEPLHRLFTRTPLIVHAHLLFGPDYGFPVRGEGQ